MTTIAFKDGVLAADTKICANGLLVGYGLKIYRHGPCLLGGAGSVAVTEKFRDWVRTGLSGDCPLTKDIGNVFIVLPSGDTITWCDDGPFRERHEVWGLGSGYQIALGAMAHGASAPEAVEIAARYDNGTGGDITVLSL